MKASTVAEDNRFRIYERKFYFIQSVIKMWNFLSEDIEMASGIITVKTGLIVSWRITLLVATSHVDSEEPPNSEAVIL